MMKKNFILWSKRAVTIVLLIMIWEVLYRLNIWPSWIFPGPAEVSITLYEGIKDGTAIIALGVTFRRLLIGFVFSIVVGSLLGFCIAKNRLMRDTIGFIILGLQTLPSICWLPLAILWFGLNEQAIIFVVIMGSLLSMTLTVDSAVRTLPPIFVRAGTILGATGWKQYRYVLLPAILPNYIGGIKQSWAFAWRSLMAGEMLFVSAGLGQLLMFGRELNDMAQVIAVMVIIVAVGIAVDKVFFGVVERSLKRKWGY